jgi:hypothetical protein
MSVAPPIDWYRWHDDYDELESSSSHRLAAVQERIAAELDRGARTVVSVAAGQSRDLLPLLIRHPRGRSVRALVVESDERNAEFAEGAAEGAGLTGLEVVTGDAGVSDVYLGHAPADLVLVCGLFEHVGPADRTRTSDALARLVAPGGSVVWAVQATAPEGADVLDATSAGIRADLAAAGFAADGPLTVGPAEFVVGTERRTGAALPLEAGTRLFTWR